jgi:hypothetical protein
MQLVTLLFDAISDFGVDPIFETASQPSLKIVERRELAHEVSQKMHQSSKQTAVSRLNSEQSVAEVARLGGASQ